MTELNRERVLAVADRIERLEYVDMFGDPRAKEDGVEGFSMEHYTYDCGTPACIAGWASHMFHSGHPGADGHHDIAARVLGLTATQALELFVVSDSPIIMSEVTVKMAVATLRRLAETGVVEWRADDA